MTEYSAKQYCKDDVERQFKKLLKIMYLYFELNNIHEFLLDLQLYNGDTEPRIWLSAPNNHLGIRLMLYSIKLCTHDDIVKNEEAIDVFSEYMKFYANSENKELFTLYRDKKDSWKPMASITFEISDRS